MPLLFSSIDKTSLSTSSSSYVDILGLSLDVSKYSSSPGTAALITLNIPATYSSGNNFPSGAFIITTNKGQQLAFGSFSYCDKKPESTGRVPFTLVARCLLSDDTATIKAQWRGDRGSTVYIDSYACISAVIE